MLKRIPVHPFLIAVYPVTAFLANNLGQVELTEGLRAASVSLLVPLVSYVALRALGIGPGKTALVISLGLLGFFSYGHLYEGLKIIEIVPAQIVRHRYLMPLILGGLALLAGVVIRIGNLEPYTLWFNVSAAAIVAISVMQIMAFRLDNPHAARTDVPVSDCHTSPESVGNQPDVYLLILDAYARADVLSELHGFDNSPFIEALEERGFYVARGSLSNYRHTEMSLASTLNMNYIQDLPGSYTPTSQNRMGLVRLIQESQVRREFECLGYNIVAFETGVFWTEWEDADYFVSRRSGLMGKLKLIGGISRFEATLLETTAFKAVEDLSTQLDPNREPAAKGSDSDHRDRILFVFDEFERASNLPGPKFVFAHVLSPHPPMVFDSSGEPVSMGRFEDLPPANMEDELLDAYVDQVIYLNSRVLEVVDEILAVSSTPPVIVIMGDHGWAERNPEDKLSVLNAYYLPDVEGNSLYPTITPVNSFRLVFDTYFGTDFGRLPDVSYFSTEADVYNFEIIENSWAPSDLVE